MTFYWNSIILRLNKLGWKLVEIPQHEPPYGWRWALWRLGNRMIDL